MRNCKDRIWFSAKSHMVSEERYRRYDVVSHLVISILSGALVCLAVIPESSRERIPLFDVVSVVTSIFVFGCSLIIYGFRFSDEAAKHRECYLSLQRLADNCENGDISSEYHDILAKFPNHSSEDCDRLIIERTFFKNESLESEGRIVAWTLAMLIGFLFRQTLFWMLCAGFPVFLIGFLAYSIAFGW